MARKFKVIGRSERRKEVIIEKVIPVDAMRLVEDIMTIEMTIKLVGRIDPDNITISRKIGDTIIDQLDTQLRMCLSYAQRKLRHEYLSGNAPVRLDTRQEKK